MLTRVFNCSRYTINNISECVLDNNKSMQRKLKPLWPEHEYVNEFMQAETALYTANKKE